MAPPSFHDQAIATLQKRGLTIADVEKWAWIVSAPCADEMAERFVSAECAKPPFLLLEILRRDILRVRTFKLLLLNTWNQLVGTHQSGLEVLPESELHATINLWSENTPSRTSFHDPVKLEDSTSIMIISRLLRHARRIWPPAIVSISHLARIIIHSISNSTDRRPVPLVPAMHHRLCKIHNHTLHLLALPASINPLKSMGYNWQAQRILIKTIEDFDPPLTLNQDSYRAVSRVLAASRKSDRESRVASLRSRNWPPWRIDQDGMDAQRSPEDDLSRVVSAVTRAKEAGYAESVEDQVARILGGQELDGTPTIQTRKLIKQRHQPAQGQGHGATELDLWAARIETTRDIQEAWGAFKNCEDQGGRPSPRMYLAMFEKLNYNKARSQDQWQYDALPGDGKEVLAPSDDNISSFYKQRLSPPTFDGLYQKMILSECRPTGRLLIFLLRHARTLYQGLRYLQESQLSKPAVAFLTGDEKISPAVLKMVPAPTFAALIAFLCRFVPRAIITEELPSEAGQAIELSQGTEPFPVRYKYRILEPRQRVGQSRHTILHHCIKLLTSSQTHFRPAWYAVFETLARRHIVIKRDLVGDPMNDLLSWKLLGSVLSAFNRCGCELDPHGFMIICNALEKAILASFEVPFASKVAAFTDFPVTLVTDEFTKLAGAFDIEATHQTPELLHSINGAHLHAYVRVLGLTKDFDGIMRLVKWMVKHHKALEDIATQSRNGPSLFRKVFVAVRVFLDGTEYEANAKRLVGSVETWDGWPEEFETQKYIEVWTGQQASDDGPEETADNYSARYS